MESRVRACLQVRSAGAPRLARVVARARDEGGQSFVEFALVVPILLIVVLAIVQFGIVYNHWETLTDATRVGGRVAATCRFISGGTGAAITAFKAAATDLPGVLNPTVSGCPSVSGGNITLTGTYPYSISVMGLVVKSGNLTATATERVE